MNETRPEAITLHALHDIRNELSPLLTDIEVPLDLCQDCEGDSSQARARASTLHTVLVVLVGQLRIQLTPSAIPTAAHAMCSDDTTPGTSAYDGLST